MGGSGWCVYDFLDSSLVILEAYFLLIEVLDDFSGPQQSTKSTTSSKQPDTQNNATEEAFIKQLEADMLAQLMGGKASGKDKAPAPAPAPPPKTNTEEPSLSNLIKMFQDMSEEDAVKFEEELKKDGGMQNLFKNLADSEGTGAGSSTSASAGVAGESFPDTIQKTLERMQESGEKITIEAKTSQDKLIDASISRLMEMAGEAAGDGGNLDLEQVFSDVIKEMSNKEMLYEPMKDYDTKYGPWLEENKATLSAGDYSNYEKQAGVIKKIVETFESKDYSDDKPECLASIWDLMQQVLRPFLFLGSERQVQSVTDRYDRWKLVAPLHQISLKVPWEKASCPALSPSWMLYRPAATWKTSIPARCLQNATSNERLSRFLSLTFTFEKNIERFQCLTGFCPKADANFGSARIMYIDRP